MDGGVATRSAARFYERVKRRGGHGKAIVATARKLAILFWCMLTRGEDYAHQQPSLTGKNSGASRSLPAPPNTPGKPKASDTGRVLFGEARVRAERPPRAWMPR